MRDGGSIRNTAIGRRGTKGTHEPLTMVQSGNRLTEHVVRCEKPSSLLRTGGACQSFIAPRLHGARSVKNYSAQQKNRRPRVSTETVNLTACSSIQLESLLAA